MKRSRISDRARAAAGRKRGPRRRSGPQVARRWVAGVSPGGELYLRRRHSTDADPRDDGAADIKYPFAQSFTFIARRWRNIMNEELRAVGQSHARWGTLYWINIYGDRINQTELAERIGVEQPTLGRVLHQLEADGLIVRRAPPGDRRARVIMLTRAAAPIMRQINRIQEKVLGQLLEDIGPHELTACLSVFAKILSNMDRHSPSPDRV